MSNPADLDSQLAGGHDPAVDSGRCSIPRRTATCCWRRIRGGPQPPGVTRQGALDPEAAPDGDTGPGIPPEKQQSIFQEFTRLDPTAQPGAGVGLAISRRIAQLLGGNLTVESEPGRGATFTVWLPPAQP